MFEAEAKEKMLYFAKESDSNLSEVTASDVDTSEGESETESVDTIMSNNLAFTHASKSLFPKEGIRLEQQQEKKLNGHNPKFQTIFKARLPSVQVEDMDEAIEGVVNNFKSMIKEMMSIDKKLILSLWWDSKGSPTKCNKGEFPVNKNELLHYVDKCFLKQSTYPYIQFIVEHSKKVEEFADPDFLAHLKDNKILLNKDRLQSRNTICIGWLMGTHPKSVNARDLEDIIKNFSFPDDDQQ